MTFVLGFWGLHVEAEKQYTQEVDTSFRVSMASFGKKISDNERSSVVAVVDGKEYVLCNLIPNKIEQQPLDVIFSMGEEITLYVTGKNEVYLTGNYIPDDDDDDDDDDEELDSDELEMNEDEELDSEEEAKLLKLIAQEDEDVEFSDEEEEDEEDEEPVPVKKVKETASSKRKAEEVSVQAPKEKKNKKEKKKENAVAPEPAAKKEETKKEETKKNKAYNSNRKELPNGLIIEDVEVGNGPKATKGKRLAMRYIGRLMNGKVFDQNTKGKPFNFKLGKGEVIKGWDQGIDGMQLNGKRRLTIPPKLAYGARGAPPDIPANATLQFDIQLIGIN